MRRRRDDLRFEIVEPATVAVVSPKRGVLDDAPRFVPMRVVRSTAPVARQDDLERPRSVDVTLLDGTRLRFAVDASAAFVVEVIAALRAFAC